MIRKNISRSQKLGQLTPEALSLFCLLLPHFNAHGKMEAHPAAIKGIVCPWIDWLDIPQIESCLREISVKTNVKWFECDGGYFLHALSWDDHQDIRRRGRDYLPSYPGELPTSARIDVAQIPPELEVEREREKEEQREDPQEQRKRSHPRPVELPERYLQGVEAFFTHFLTEDHSTWREAYPGIDVEAEAQKAKLWLLSNPRNRKKNFSRFLTNWLARSQERAPRRGGTIGTDCPYPPGTPEHSQYLEAEKQWKERV